MASHFKWYPAESEVVVPFNARYSFPSQANKAMKMTPRIPPKNASEFNPGNVIRLEFPAQGYVNPGKTTLEFDVEMIYDPIDTETSELRFQNNIQSIFNRVRLLYGATPIEDIPYYNVIVRSLTEWTSTLQTGGVDQTSIAEGIGGTIDTLRLAVTPVPSDLGTITKKNARQRYIQGISMIGDTAPSAANAFTSQAECIGFVPNATNATSFATVGSATNTRNYIKKGTPVRRYQVQLALGIFNQEKLIPTKFMASQLAIEITLENPSACMYFKKSQPWEVQTAQPTGFVLGTPSNNTPTYKVKNVNLLPEILEFDASYDESFLRGLQSGGVPIKFSTWNNYRFSQTGVSSMNLQIQERSRSVKSIFVMQRRDPVLISTDSGASFFNTGGVSTTDCPSTLQEFQFRIGGR